MKTRIVPLLALGAVTLVAQPAASAAQEACGWCGENGNTHIAREWISGGDYTKGHGWHPFSYSSFTCDYPHGMCIWVMHDGTPTNSLEVTDRIAEAVAHADLPTLADLLREPKVHASWDRLALQVESCDGSIAGHVPVGEVMLRRAEALATRQTAEVRGW